MEKSLDLKKLFMGRVFSWVVGVHLYRSEYNYVEYTKAALLQWIHFISKTEDIISSRQNMNPQNFLNLTFKQFLKNSFHSIKLEHRESYGKKFPWNGEIVIYHNFVDMPDKRERDSEF